MIHNSVERYFIEQGFEAGMKEGIEQGIEKSIGKGIEKGIEMIISNFLINSNWSDEEIADNSNLPLDKVLEIKNKIQINSK